MLKASHSRRQDYEYKRHSTRKLFLFVEPKAGQRTGLATQRRVEILDPLADR